MELLVLGLNHKTAPVQIREQFAIAEAALPEAAERARAVVGCTESFVVSTCNRVELYAACDDAARLEASLTGVFASVGVTRASAVEQHLYTHRGRDAIRHLFRVAASLDSMVVGEPQILGQLKVAFETCRRGGVTGPGLNRAVERAFAVAKRVRTRTGIGRSSVSISSVAVDLARQIFGELGPCVALLVGAGKMGELAARSLRGAGAGHLLVANRSFDRAQKVAEKLGGHPRSLDELDELLVRADIVITSTGAPGYLLDVRRMKRIRKARKYRPLFLIDIAVPRNIDPGCNQLDGVFLYDVDDLSETAADNLESRRREASVAEEMVGREADIFVREMRAELAKPTIVALRQKASVIKRGELERVRSRLGELDPKQLKAVEMLADGIVNKLLHGVQTSLKASASDGDKEHVVGVVREMFGLDGEGE